jgi:hypothetical protein
LSEAALEKSETSKQTPTEQRNVKNSISQSTDFLTIQHRGRASEENSLMTINSDQRLLEVARDRQKMYEDSVKLKNRLAMLETEERKMARKINETITKAK